MSKFIANKKQKEAFDRVVKAIKAAKKAGLIFYGKADTLVAYTKHADNYVDKHGFENCLLGDGSQIHCLSETILQDSGADDYPQYISDKDNPDYQ